MNQGKVPGSKLRWHGTRRPHLRLSALHQASCWPAGHILRAGKSAGTPSAGQPFARASFGKTRRSETGQHQRWHRSNNAFKPRPLRGLVQVLLDFPLAQGRKSVRLNSALDRSRTNAGQEASGLARSRWPSPFSRPLSLATNSVPARAAGTPFLGSASRKERLSALDSGQIGSLVKSHGWHRSNNSFKPSPLRGLVQVPCKFHLPKAANRPGLTQALCVVTRNPVSLG